MSEEKALAKRHVPGDERKMPTYNRTLNALRRAETLETAWSLYHGAAVLAEDETERDFAAHTRERTLERLFAAGVRPAPAVGPFFGPAYL